MLIYFIVALSIAFQLAAAIMALRLMRVTGDKLSWAAIATAMGLQTVRRVLTLMDLVTGRVVTSQILTAESIGLALSILMAAGVATIGPYFNSIKKSIAERKKAEEKYSTLVEKSNDGIVIIQDGLLKFANKKMLEMSGFSLDETIGSLFLDFVSPEYKAMVADNYERRVIGEDVPNRYEIDIIGKDGHHIPVEINASRIEYEEKPADMAIIRDITERKRSEEALRESEQRYRDLFDKANDLIQSVAPDGHLLYVNEAWRRTLGYTEEEIAGLKVWDIIHPDSIDHCMKVLRRVMSGEDVSGIEAVFVAKDGTPVEVEGNAHGRFIDGRPNSTQGIFKDVTERKRAEERVRHLNSVLRALRNVNQLITRESSREHLIQRSCDILVRDRGYEKAWIILMSEWGKPLAVAAAGIGDEHSLFLEKMKAGEYPHCIKELWDNENRFLVYDCPGQKHPDCIMADTHKDRGVYRCRLEYEGTVYGVLGVTLPLAFVDIEEEQSLFLELADDISFALESMRRQEEHRRAEEALIQSEAKCKAIFDAAVDGIVLTDPQTRKFYSANNSFCRMLGYSEEEIKHIGVADIHPPEKLAYILKRFKAQARQDVVLSMDIPVKRKDGSVFYADINSAPVSFDGKQYLMGVFRDTTERRKAEEALANSEVRYRRLFETAQDAILILNGDTGQIIDANPFIKDLLGYTMEELRGKNLWEIGELKDTLASKLSYTRLHDKGYIRYDNLPLVTRDGQNIDVEVVANAYQVDHQNVIQCNIRDISERRQAEESLQESEEKYRSLVGNIRLGIFRTTPGSKGRFLEVNHAMTEITGFYREELMEMNPRDLYLNPEERERVLAEVASTKQGSTTELSFRKKDGSIMVVRDTKTPVRDVNGNVLYFDGILEDITERRKAEEALKQYDSRLHSILTSIPDLVFVFDKDGRFSSFHVASEETYVSPEIFIGKKCTEVMPPDVNIKFTEAFDRNKNGEVAEFEYSLEIKGETKWYYAKISPILVDGISEGSVAVSRNITERKRMEEQLIVTDRLASVGELASGIAHELNNPLTGVIGLSELIMKRDVPEDILKDLKMVNSEAQRAAQVVKNLLTFARKHPLSRQPLNVNDILDKVLELRAYEQRVNNIRVANRMSSKLPQIMADYFQLQQVFLNIIINAEYFMTEAHGRGVLTVTTKKVGNTIRVSLADDGPGIPPSDVGRIFDPFFSTKDVGKGTGLGLSISHGIVVSHGGKLSVESNPGKGTTFIVELPITQE